MVGRSGTKMNRISNSDAWFIDRLRGFSIMRVVLMHLGLGWIFTPYSQLLGAFLPVLFFVSGAVSFFSYQRSRSVNEFLLKRLPALLIPYYLIVGIMLLFWQAWYGALDFILLMDWLLLVPNSSDYPMPMTHIWFLHALAIMTFISVPIFCVSKNGSLALIVSIFLLFIVSNVQSVAEISKMTDLGGHNMYQALSCLPCFLLGALYYRNRDFFSVKINIFICVIFILLAIANVSLFELPFKLSENSYAPNGYYVSSSIAALFLLLALQNPITTILNKITALDWATVFFCRHAYPIYILHPLFIIVSEEFFGWKDVMDRPIFALMKILFVVLASCFVAIPIAKFSKVLITKVRELLLHTPKAGIVSKKHGG